MVKGIDIFQEYFREYTDQYVLIVEARTKEFREQFWQFLKDGKYRNRAKSNGEPQFYRFDKPEDPRSPKAIELFSRTDYLLMDKAGLTPIHVDNAVSSPSAILLNDAYYQAPSTYVSGAYVCCGLFFFDDSI